MRLVVANWKMNCDKASASRLVSAVMEAFTGNITCGIGGVEVVFCPPYVYLGTVSAMINNSSSYQSSCTSIHPPLPYDNSVVTIENLGSIEAACNITNYSSELSLKFTLGAQDVSEYCEYGPHTGQVNSRMLFDLGCKYSIVGHSECRIAKPESNLSISKKVCSLLKSKVTPIICVGESTQQRNSGTYINEILEQLHGSIHLLDTESISDVIIAYEPLWSIGSGNIPTPSDINEVATVIKNHYTGIKFLYGGSVNSSNISMLSSINSIDGILVGNASLDAREFTKIIRAVSYKEK